MVISGTLCTLASFSVAPFGPVGRGLYSASAPESKQNKIEFTLT